MHVRDASGRRVSLLNEDVASMTLNQLPHYADSHPAPLPYYRSSARSASSSPNTPELLRSDSYDSQMSNEPISPLTPAVYDFNRRVYGTAPAISDSQSPYEEYANPIQVQAYASSKRPSHLSDSRSASYEDPASPAGAERPGKRYPCRYRDSHGCDKTFTTSGHASRHSKIHTAEKAVPCSFPSCSKKFTRADNMKQHLDTHYKDKSRSSTSRQSLSSSERRSSASGKSSSSRQKTSPSPDLRVFEIPVLGASSNAHSSAARTPSGLDALASLAIERQNSY